MIRLALLVTALALPAFAESPAPAVPAEPAAVPAEPVGPEFLAPAAAPDTRVKLESYWDNGYHLESSDKQFRLHVGGNAQIDSTWLIGPNSVFAVPGGGANGIDNASATFLRRVRLRFDGDIYQQFDYAVEYDFANAANDNSAASAPPSFGSLIGSPAPANVWMQIRDLPALGTVRVGYQVKPIGMTSNTNQGQLPFLERADNNDAFYGPFDNGFALGVTSRNVSESERTTWQYGVYRPLTNAFGVGLNKTAVGGRVTALPLYEEGGEQLAHVGLGVWAGELPENKLRVRARPLLRNGPGFAVPVLVDTGNVPGGRQYTLAPEFAAVAGPWTLQAEYAGQFFTAAGPGTVYYHGGYVELLYFLTGEHQVYEKREGVFGRVVPRNNLHVVKGDDCRTFGAWQVGARFGYLDLTDKTIDGGRVYDLTLGLNWFINPNMKFQFNYILENRDAPQGVAKGWINGLGLRAAYDF